MSIQNLTNGIIYWFVRVMSPFTERMVSQPVYTIRYYEHTLQYSARQVLSDNYTSLLRATAETGAGDCRLCRAAGRLSGHAGRVLVPRACRPPAE
ncbi:hypothetical protein QWI30_00445 [Citrobacter freundii]|nr:hypothetical protein [Citrobacter freundii]